MPAFLSNITYNEQGREIITEYSSSEGKIIKRERFFPKTFLSKRFPREYIEEVFHLLEKNTLMLSETSKALEVKARDFSSLKAFLNALRKTSKHKSLVPLSLIEPERQHLTQNNSSFFDSFEEYKGRLHRTDSLPSVSECVKETGFHLLPQALAERMALASLLKTSPETIPLTRTGIAETFLENCFFEQGIPFPELHKNKQNHWLSIVDSSVLETNNLGFESMNCSCCSSRKDNLAPSSKARVRFVKDAVYFDSLSRHYSAWFHSARPGKQAREERKREFGLLSMPVGPFYKGDEEEVLLADLSYLKRNGLAEVTGLGQAQWFCVKRESFLSKTVKRLSRQHALVEARIRGLEENALGKHNLAAFPLLREDPDHCFLCALSSSMKELTEFLPSQLVYSKSKFFVQGLAENISLIDSALAEKQGNLATARATR